MPTYRGKDSVITTITLPRGLHRQVRVLAKKRYIKLSPLIRGLLSDWLTKNQTKPDAKEPRAGFRHPYGPPI